MVTYTYYYRLKKGVVIMPHRIYKYPRFMDDFDDKIDYDFCQMTLSFAGIESALHSFKIIIDGVDDV